MAADPISLHPPDKQQQSTPPEDRAATLPEAARRSSYANITLTIVAILAALYFARMVCVVLFISLLLAFVLEPLTRLFERIRLPRSVAALISVLIVVAALYGLFYVSYSKAMDFARDLPTYSGEIRRYVTKFRKQAQTIQKSTEQVLPTETTDKNTVKVQQQTSWVDKLLGGIGSATELIFAASFVPFMAYFMLTWKEHARTHSVLLFSRSNRSTAYATMGAITEMVRGFIVGNVLVGLFIGAISTAIFGLLGIPYFYFIGFISGFLSLVPYLGVLLAAVPPLLAGVGHIHSSEFLIVMVTVVGVHLFALNVLYPKFLGSRLQLNPLAVTVALLFWGWIWGAMGLILAIPLTAAIKIICDHVDELRPVGGLLGE
jgi:predicted PurR-regulated permease PerM